MLCDSIDNFIANIPAVIPAMQDLSALLGAVKVCKFEELKEMDFSPLDVRFNEYDTKPDTEVPFESHVKFWDLQIVVEGAEYIGIAPVESLSLTNIYDEKEDVAFYSGTGQKILLKPGTAVLLAPWDGHQPGLSVTKIPSHVKKIVVKIPAKNF
jgi:biofilm protein TabA